MGLVAAPHRQRLRVAGAGVPRVVRDQGHAGSVADPRRLVTVDLPVRLGASLSDARRVAQEAASTVPQGDELAIYVQIGAVTETTAWLHVVAYAPFGADVSHVASEIREQTVAALASADLLPV